VRKRNQTSAPDATEAAAAASTAAAISTTSVSSSLPANVRVTKLRLLGCKRIFLPCTYNAIRLRLYGLRLLSDTPVAGAKCPTPSPASSITTNATSVTIWLPRWRYSLHGEVHSTGTRIPMSGRSEHSYTAMRSAQFGCAWRDLRGGW